MGLSVLGYMLLEKMHQDNTTRTPSLPLSMKFTQDRREEAEEGGA